MTYSGSMLRSLINSTLCLCSATLGEHSHEKLECPNETGPLFGPMVFTEDKCQLATPQN